MVSIQNQKRRRRCFLTACLCWVASSHQTAAFAALGRAAPVAASMHQEFSLQAVMGTDESTMESDAAFVEEEEKVEKKDLVSDFCVATNEFFKGTSFQNEVVI